MKAVREPLRSRQHRNDSIAKTKGLYDRRSDDVSVWEVERIGV